MRVLLVLLLGLAVGRAAADEGTPPPTLSPEDLALERAREFYQKGARDYERGRYQAALQAFESALAASPQPDFHLSIARCHERLGQWERAAAAYQQFLSVRPSGKESAEARERLADVSLRAREAAHVPAAPTPHPSYRAPAIALLATALVLGGAGLGITLSQLSEYEDRRKACDGRCSPESLDGLRTRIDTAEAAGGAVLALAGAALVADVVLWIYDAKGRREQPRLSAGAGGLTVRF